MQGLGLIVHLLCCCPEMKRILILTENLHQLKRLRPAVTWLCRSWVSVVKQEQNFLSIGLWLGCDLDCPFTDHIPLCVLFKWRGGTVVFHKSTSAKCHVSVALPTRHLWGRGDGSSLAVVHLQFKAQEHVAT